MRKKTTALVLTLALLLAVCLVPAGPVWAAELDPAAGFAGGDGSAESPYLIADAAGLALLAASAGESGYAGEHFLLTADIDLSGAAWTPVPVFAGTLDGGGHTVSGLTLSGDAADLGLFGTLSGATVRSLTVEGELTDMTAGSDVNAGGIAARSNGAVLSDVHVRMDVGGAKLKGQGRIGGLIGRGDGDTTLEDCSYTGEMTISSATYLLVGGLVGAMEAGALTVTGCTVRGSFALTQDAATLRLGGAAGKSLNGSISGTLVEAAISGSTAEGAILRMGGMVGDQYATVVEGAPGLTLSGCAFLGSVTAVQGSAVVGGMVGNADKSGACGLTRCLSTDAGVGLTGNAKHYVFVESGRLTALPQMQPGAAVRGYLPTGLRWTTELDAAALASLESNFGADAVSFGTLIAPADYVAAAGAFTKEALEVLGAEHDLPVSYVDVPYLSENWFAETGTQVCFTGALANMLEVNYARPYGAVGYLTVRLTDDFSVTVYAEYDPDNARTIEEVAWAAYTDRSATQTEEYAHPVPADSEYAVGDADTYSPYAPEMLGRLKELCKNREG